MTFVFVKCLVLVSPELLIMVGGKDQSVDGRIILRWVFRKYYMLHAQSMLFLISYLMRGTDHEIYG